MRRRKIEIDGELYAWMQTELSEVIKNEQKFEDIPSEQNIFTRKAYWAGRAYAIRNILAFIAGEREIK